MQRNIMLLFSKAAQSDAIHSLFVISIQIKHSL